MKKTILILLCACLFISLCACETVSDNNVVVSGDLNADISILTASDGEWSPLGSAPSFKGYPREPGAVSVSIARVENTGALAVKWQLRLENSFAFGELADVIDVYVKVGQSAYPTSRQEVESWECLGTLAEISNLAEGILLADEDCAYVAIALRMQDTAPAHFNGVKPASELSISALISQYSAEEDAFGNDYDQ